MQVVGGFEDAAQGLNIGPIWAGTRRARYSWVSGTSDLISSNTRLRTEASVMR